MPCATSDMAEIRCNNPFFSSPTVQRKILRQFLCAIADSLNPETSCTEANLLASSADLLCQGSPDKLRMTQMQVICDQLDIDCEPVDCLTPMQEEAIITYLVCRILDEIV